MLVSIELNEWKYIQIDVTQGLRDELFVSVSLSAPCGVIRKKSQRATYLYNKFCENCASCLSVKR